MNCSFQGVYLFDQVVEALCNAEVKFIAVERIKEYLSIPAEVECSCTFICLTSVTRAKCGIPSTLCWKIVNISGSI